MTVWVVCADSARARIFSAESARDQLSEVQDLSHPESRIRPRDMVSDRDGRRADSVGRGMHGVGGERDEPKREEAERFARTLGQTLNEAGRSGRYQRLHILAAPAFLGLLRHHLADDVRTLLRSETAANIVTQGIKEIRAHLPERL
ncbi:MAG: host attachment protein [Gammaproteobacteria bacterium]|nr:host attachment protein [Gammaproteobacteria bacterium]